MPVLVGRGKKILCRKKRTLIFFQDFFEDLVYLLIAFVFQGLVLNLAGIVVFQPDLLLRLCNEFF